MEKYDVLEAAAIEAASPPRGKSESPQQESLNDLAHEPEKDTAEKVNTEIPAEVQAPLRPKPKKEKAAPIVRTTKASQARMSIAHGDAVRAPPALGRPRQSMAASDGKRVLSTSSLKSSGDGEGMLDQLLGHLTSESACQRTLVLQMTTIVSRESVGKTTHNTLKKANR
jgi:hypothetical protein